MTSFLPPRPRRASHPPAAKLDAPAPRRQVRQALADLLRSARGTALVFMAVTMLALGTATGVGVDFARGLNFKSALQGAVDAAAIAGASVYLNSGYSGQATAAATNYMTNATANLPTNNGVHSSVSVSASAPWTVTVSANSTINSSFNGLLESTIPVSVSATANGPTNPNIDFYLLLDSSPSMGIAATQDGISTMVANTPGQCDSAPNGGASCGCAFACHESHPSSESHFIPVGTGSPVCKGPQICTNGTCSNVSRTSPNYASSYSSSCTVSGTGNPNGEDNYALARALGVTLRIDNLQTATQRLMTTAQTTSASNGAAYRVAIYTFDVAVNTIQTLTSSFTTAATNAANIAQLEIYSNNYLTSTNRNSDADTNYDNAMTTLNATMPRPGGGTNADGDSPQEVLFLVTDGVEDETVNGSRQQSLMSTSWCNTIKNRGIRIAVLYTTYDPLTTNSWYNTYISPFQADIASNMRSCASPGLFFQVDTGGDITAAMTALFNSAVQSAYISR